MRKIPASLVAMMTAWAVIMTAYATWGATHETKSFMLAGVAYATAACSLAAWLIVVLPLIHWWGEARLLGDLRWSWLGWMLMGAGSFLLLLVPLFGPEVFAGVWCPAAMGMIAGTVFGWLRRKSRTAPPAPPV